MRIVLINPPSPDGHVYIRDVNRSGRVSREGTIWPQTSLAMIAAMFPEHDVRIWDCIAEGIDYVEVGKRLQELKPDWVILETVSCTIERDLGVASYAKFCGAKTIVISPHMEALESETRERYPFIDHVVRYEKLEEPEYAIREIVTGQPRGVDESFSTLPLARQDLLPLSRYNLPFIGRNYTFVITSRGCPWKCIYCRQTVTWKSRVRYRSPESIVDEIKTNGLTNISFHADTATVNRKQMMEICRLMPKGVRWICNSRVDTVDPQMLKAMKRAGCWMICFGIESGNDRVLAMNKKEATVKHATQAVKWAKEAGLQVWGYFMLGMYGDTVESMEQTIALSKRLPLDIANFALAAPYPGTEWGNIAEENNWLDTKEWQAYDQNVSAIVSQPGCGPKEVLAAQKRAYRRWYGSWRGVKFFLNGWRPRYTRFFWNVALNHLRG